VGYAASPLTHPTGPSHAPLHASRRRSRRRRPHRPGRLLRARLAARGRRHQQPLSARARRGDPRVNPRALRPGGGGGLCARLPAPHRHRRAAGEPLRPAGQSARLVAQLPRLPQRALRRLQVRPQGLGEPLEDLPPEDALGGAQGRRRGRSLPVRHRRRHHLLARRRGGSGPARRRLADAGARQLPHRPHLGPRRHPVVPGLHGGAPGRPDRRHLRVQAVLEAGVAQIPRGGRDRRAGQPGALGQCRGRLRDHQAARLRAGHRPAGYPAVPPGKRDHRPGRRLDESRANGRLPAAQVPDAALRGGEEDARPAQPVEGAAAGSAERFGRGLEVRRRGDKARPGVRPRPLRRDPELRRVRHHLGVRGVHPHRRRGQVLLLARRQGVPHHA
jgi:hypothetical protein